MTQTGNQILTLEGLRFAGLMTYPSLPETAAVFGHWLHSDQPEVFLAVMRRFLHL